MQAALIGIAQAARVERRGDAASGTPRRRRYGRLLEPRKLVGVRGAGPAFDGLYYVEQRHERASTRGEFKQNFELSRNGLVLHRRQGAGMTRHRSSTASTAARWSTTSIRC